MPRPFLGAPTCESCPSIDVRQWHREGRLNPGQRFSWSWRRGGEPAGSITVRVEPAAVVLVEQLRRIRQVRALRRPSVRDDAHILLRGVSAAVRVVHSQTWRAPNRVTVGHGAITVTCKSDSKTMPARLARSDEINVLGRGFLVRALVKVGPFCDRLVMRSHFLPG
jgi:hypothetical protein